MTTNQVPTRRPGSIPARGNQHPSLPRFGKTFLPDTLAFIVSACLVAPSTAPAQDPPADTEGPVCIALSASSDTAPVGGTVEIRATMDDSQTGGSAIASARFGWSLVGNISKAFDMDPEDGAFDSATEVASCTVGPFSRAGTYWVDVWGDDIHWNEGPIATLFIEVSDHPHPVIEPLDLGTELDLFLGRTVSSEAVAVNDLGQVVVNDLSSNGHAYLWSADTGFVDLGTLGGANCEARAVNGAGHVVGNSETAEGDTHAFRWTPETGILDMATVTDPKPRTYPNCSADFINEQGQVAGHITSETDLLPVTGAAWWGTGLEPTGIHDSIVGPSSSLHELNNLGQAVGTGKFTAFSWDAESGMQLLAPPDDALYVFNWAYAVNDRGEVVGASGGRYGSPYGPAVMKFWMRACLWSPEGVPAILEQTGCWFSEAWDANNAGQVVGTSATNFSDTEPGDMHAALWTPVDEGWIQADLGTLNEAFPYSYAVAINELGQVIGYCEESHPLRRTVAWTEPVGMVELRDLGRQVSEACALNNLGSAVGYSTTSSWAQHACVWQLPMPPLVPEEEVEVIVDEVIDLVEDGTLGEGDGTSLVTTLEAAADKFAEGRTKPAENMLEAFINKVEAKVKSGKLTAEEGMTLITAALAVLEG